MNAGKTTRRTALFWLASGGIFFFMDMQILGESAIAAPPAEQVCHASSAPAAAAERAVPIVDLAGELITVELVAD